MPWGCLLILIIYPLSEHRQQVERCKGRSLAEEPTWGHGGRAWRALKKSWAFGPRVDSNTISAPY